MRANTVSADTDNLGASLLKYGIELTKLQAFSSAAWRIVFRIEEQYELLASKLG